MPSSTERLATVLVVASLALVLAAVGWYGQGAVPGRGEPGVHVFELTGVASDGVWTLDEVNGLNYWWKEFTPATLSIRQGEEVVLNLRSADLFHCFYLPAFDVGPVDVEPGHMVTVRFTASEPGVHQYYCTSMCGSCHFYMRGWVVVTPPGEEPVKPPPIVCRRCLPGALARPAGDDLVELGSFLYQQHGCVACHGPEGRGGVPNPNSTLGQAPAHDVTAEKLFLRTPEDASAFLALVRQTEDLGAVDEVPEVPLFPVVRARWLDAEIIVRQGRYSARLEPSGPEPPLQMPAWQHLVPERDIDALLAYFVSLYPWEDETL